MGGMAWPAQPCPWRGGMRAAAAVAQRSHGTSAVRAMRTLAGHAHLNQPKVLVQRGLLLPDALLLLVPARVAGQGACGGVHAAARMHAHGGSSRRKPRAHLVGFTAASVLLLLLRCSCFGAIAPSAFLLLFGLLFCTPPLMAGPGAFFAFVALRGFLLALWLLALLLGGGFCFMLQGMRRQKAAQKQWWCCRLESQMEVQLAAGGKANAENARPSDGGCDEPRLVCSSSAPNES